jgi:hypothetical protein
MTAYFSGSCPFATGSAPSAFGRKIPSRLGRSTRSGYPFYPAQARRSGINHISWIDQFPEVVDFGIVGVFGRAWSHGAMLYFSIQRKSARRLKPSLRAVSLLFPSQAESVASRCFLITSASAVPEAECLGVASRR